MSQETQFDVAGMPQLQRRPRIEYPYNTLRSGKNTKAALR